MDLMPAGDVLATTLATEFSPATNLRGEAAGAAWRYLLPSMERARVLCVGRAPAGTLRTLAVTASEVTVLGADGDALGRPPSALVVVPPSELDAWLAARPERSIDLAWIGTGGGRDGERAAARLGRLLTDDAVVVRERTGPAGGGTIPDADTIAGTGTIAGRRVVSVDVRPDSGEIRSAVATGDDVATRHLVARGLAGPATTIPSLVPRRLGRPAERLLDRLPVRGRRRRLELTIPVGAATLPDVPDYLSAIAAADGIDLRGWRCALSATGVYNTQKVLAFLREPGAMHPAIVVKMTRDASVVRRLENERDALRALESLGMAVDGRVPTVRFAGRHAGLAIVGETAADGRPYTAPATGRETVDPAADAVAWLSDLAARSVRPAAAADVAAALTDLHRRFVVLCRPTSDLADRLEAAIAAIATSAVPFPLVFQHGDPGTWNLLRRDDGSVVVLDWENADPAGMPLWDLLYLLRSQAVGAGRRGGTRRRLSAVERFLFDDSPMADFIVESVGRYAERIGLDPALVEPVFHTCWMHQALKEATRVAPERVHGAHFNRLLRLGIDRRTAPVLRRLFEAGA